jgi:hypothetical protein
VTTPEAEFEMPIPVDVELNLELLFPGASPQYGGSGCGLRHVGPPVLPPHPTATAQNASNPAAIPRPRTLLVLIARCEATTGS